MKTKIVLMVLFLSGCNTLNPVEEALEGKSHIMADAHKKEYWESQGMKCHYVGDQVVDDEKYACQK